MNALYVRTSVSCYFRYKLQCPLISYERSTKYDYLYFPDILIINKNRYPIEVEIKVSLSDLKNDMKKRIWTFRKLCDYQHPMPYQFYYAVPEKLTEKAREIIKIWKKEEQPNKNAGLLTVIEKDTILDNVYVSIPAIINKESKRLSIHDIIHMVRNQSGTICSLGKKICQLQKIKNRNPENA